MTDVISETNSSYRGAVIRLRHQKRALQINAGYTWAHAIDDGQNEATFADHNDVYDPANMRLEHGTSNYDVRQRVAGGVVVREPWRLRGTNGLLLGGYSLSAAGEWHTGLPWSMRTAGSIPAPSCSYLNWLNAGGATGRGSDCLQAVHQPDETFDSGMAGQAVPIPAPGLGLNGSGGENLIPAIGRNTFRYPAGVHIDLRITKHIRLSDRCSFDLMGEAFNALNHRNVTGLPDRWVSPFERCQSSKHGHAHLAKRHEAGNEDGDGEREHAGGVCLRSDGGFWRCDECEQPGLREGTAAPGRCSAAVLRDLSQFEASFPRNRQSGSLRVISRTESGRGGFSCRSWTRSIPGKIAMEGSAGHVPRSQPLRWPQAAAPNPAWCLPNNMM